MINELLQHKKIILGSQSPRRSQLMSELNIPFVKRVIETNEAYDPHLDPYKVAEYLSLIHI